MDRQARTRRAPLGAEEPVGANNDHTLNFDARKRLPQDDPLLDQSNSLQAPPDLPVRLPGRPNRPYHP